MKLAGPDGAGDTVNHPSSDEEEVSTDTESDQEDSTVAHLFFSLAWPKVH